MHRPTRRQLVHLALLAAVLGAAVCVWQYPAWRFARDYRAAEAAFARYDFPTARERLARCEERRPDDPAVHLLTCRAARRAGDLADAEKHHSRYWLLVSGKTPDAALEEALLKAQRGQVAEVVEFLIYQLDAKNPRSEEIQEALAVGCARTYNLDRANFWISELLARAPKNPIGRLLKAQTVSTLGRVEEAIDILRELVRDFPKDVEARLTLAALLLTTNQLPEALDAFVEARRLAPENTVALLGYSRVLLRLGRTDDLRQLLPELERRGDNSEALMRCGEFAILEKRWADAEGYLTRALALAPNDHEIHKHLAVSLFQLGKVEDAQRHSDRARAIEADLARMEKLVAAMLKAPRDPVPRLEAGQICLKYGQTDEGLRWLFGALEITPGHKPTHRALADYYSAQGDSQLAAYHRKLAQ
jgi:tetratricopeptide (TPR) repeat protein